MDKALTTSAQMRAAVARLGKAFPNYHVALIRAVGAGPWVAAMFQSSGTMEHALEVPGALSIPATGRHFRQTWTAFIRFEGDLIAEFHEHYDPGAVSNQLMGLATPKPWENQSM